VVWVVSQFQQCVAKAMTEWKDKCKEWFESDPVEVMIKEFTKGKEFCEERYRAPGPELPIWINLLVFLVLSCWLCLHEKDKCEESIHMAIMTVYVGIVIGMDLPGDLSVICRSLRLQKPSQGHA
jgi:hypothetical protein